MPTLANVALSDPVAIVEADKNMVLKDPIVAVEANKVLILPKLVLRSLLSLWKLGTQLMIKEPD